MVVALVCTTPALAQFESMSGRTMKTQLAGTLDLQGRKGLGYEIRMNLYFSSAGKLFITQSGERLDGKALPDAGGDEGYVIDLNAGSGSGRVRDATYSYSVAPPLAITLDYDGPKQSGRLSIQADVDTCSLRVTDNNVGKSGGLSYKVNASSIACEVVDGRL